MDYIIVNGELYHHGVKGMRWGQRKDTKKNGTIQKIRDKNIAKQKKSDAVKKSMGKNRYAMYRFAYGKRGTERIYDRKKDKGLTYKQAERREFGRQFLIKSGILLASAAALTVYKNRGFIAVGATQVSNAIAYKKSTAFVDVDTGRTKYGI